MSNNKKTASTPKRAKYTFTSFDPVLRNNWIVKVSTTTLGSILVILQHTPSSFTYVQYFDDHEAAAHFIDSYLQEETPE
jgi:hypothetical protein